MKVVATKINNITILDRWGIGLSFICLVHCVATPLLMMSLPILARYYLAHPWFHLGLAILIVPVAFLAFWQGFRHHRNFWVLALGFPGLAIITLVPYLFHSRKIDLHEPIWMLIGSALLVTAHLLNRRSCACDRHHH